LTKHQAAFHAARSRKMRGVPTMTYYKCQHCKRFHLTSNGFYKNTQDAVA
jgi:molybdenum cofactor biosynthesis enzyme MoaA